MEEASLTAEERHKLLSALRDLDPKAPREQRDNPRRRVQMELWIRPLGERTPRMRAMLVNVASQGVGLHVERPLKQGQKFLLRLRFMEGGGWLVLCETRNVRPVGAAFKIGARFLERIDDEDGTTRAPMDWLM